VSHRPHWILSGRFSRNTKYGGSRQKFTDSPTPRYSAITIEYSSISSLFSQPWSLATVVFLLDLLESMLWLPYISETNISRWCNCTKRTCRQLDMELYCVAAPPRLPSAMPDTGFPQRLQRQRFEFVSTLKRLLDSRLVKSITGSADRGKRRIGQSDATSPSSPPEISSEASDARIKGKNVLREGECFGNTCSNGTALTGI
jgi:hypothetical protein